MHCTKQFSAWITQLVQGLMLHIQLSFIVKDYRNGVELHESLCSQTYIITNQ